jgi:hypothetical protein
MGEKLARYSEVHYSWNTAHGISAPKRDITPDSEPEEIEGSADEMSVSRTLLCIWWTYKRTEICLCASGKKRRKSSPAISIPMLTCGCRDPSITPIMVRVVSWSENWCHLTP